MASDTPDDSTTASTAEPTASPFEYVRIRPSEEPLPADRVTEQFEQLHHAIGEHTVEVLLTTTGDDEIAYHVGTDPEALAALRRVCSRIVPDSYALEPVDGNPLAEVTPVTVAELHGVAERRGDWQTRLRPPTLSDAPEQHDTARVEDTPGLPLESVVEGLTAVDGRVAYQALLEPKPDWTGEAEYRVRQLERNRDTVGQRLFRTVVGPVDDEAESNSPRRAAHRRGDVGSVPGTRIDAILAKSARNSYRVNARIVAGAAVSETPIHDLAAAFSAVGGDFYDVRPVIHDDPADALTAAVTERTLRTRTTIKALTQRLPLAANRSPRIVADSTTVAHFALLDGTGLTDTARRALRALPSERTGLTPPDGDTLAHYDHGLTIGRPRRQDGRPLETTVALPPSLQPLHTAWFGKTGSGKSTALTRAITANHQATEGADIAVLPKGDEMATALLRTQYAEQGDLDDVYYFDCSETVPALSFFDIRDALAAGVSRTTAVQDITDHYIELLRAITGRESFDSAVRSPDVIRYLVKALFDPEHGADAFTHRDLERAVRKFRTEEKPPLVSDPDLRGMLAGVTENDDRTFDRIMQGVANRIEKVPLDDRLARLFNHVAEPDGPVFDIAELLDANALIILDTGGLRDASQHALTLALLSSLWTALRERAQRRDGELPLVNLYLEEAADLAVSTLLSELLAQSRSFGLAVTLAMQFPGQLRAAAPEAYAELMNNVSTIVTGNVAVDTQLQQRLATGAMPPDEVGNRLRALSRGEWLTALPAPFDEPEPRPFVVESLPLPAGHPDTDGFSEVRAAAFQAERELCGRRTTEDAGLSIGAQTPASDTAAGDASARPDDAAALPDRLDTPLPYTDRFPSPITYDAAAHRFQCDHCDAQYPATIDGLRSAIVCDASLDRVDGEDIPVCTVPFRLTTDAVADSPYTHQQLLFLQAVYAAGRFSFDRDLEYDPCTDSMVRLREYCGLDAAAVEDLVRDGLVRKDCQKPHLLYTVTSEGRDAVSIPHGLGVGYGDGVGDLGESTLHRVMVAYGRRYIEQRFVDDETSPVTDAATYVDVADGRLDAAGLDEDGEVVVTLEAERGGNDTARAAVADFDTMAAADPVAAIWVVDSRETAQDVLGALHDPLSGPQRITKTYSENTAPSQFTYDTEGVTEMVTLGSLYRDRAIDV